MRRWISLSLPVFVYLAFWVAPAQNAAAQTVASAPASLPGSNDYSNPANWLCLPGRQDACAVNLTTTVIAANGTQTLEHWNAAPHPPVDCFYVYPTVSREPALSADMRQTPELKAVVKAQFARFAQVCRPFAPVYRQITMFGLLARLAGRPLDQAQALATRDVTDAWHYYLKHQNHGRGVILIGHSQGANILQRLIAAEIDGKPIQSRIVVAAIIGSTIAVPKGADVGGTFSHMPLCRSDSQTGCILTYESFAANLPPAPGGLFAEVGGANMTAACTNPAALAGAAGELHAYLPSRANAWVDAALPGAWVKTHKPILTPFVSLPGMLTAECASSDGLTYLAITSHPSAGDARTGEFGGEVVHAGILHREWGLHIIDVNLAQGNLIQIFRQQSKAWLAAQPRPATQPRPAIHH